MPRHKPTRSWRTTTSSSAGRTEISREQPASWRQRRWLVGRAFVTAIVLVAVLTSCGGDAAPSASVADDVGASGSAMGDYDLQGHRGARGLRPESTLPGFEVALDLMVDTLEFDLHLSADDVVIVWHDASIEPKLCGVTSSTRRVREMTAAELAEIRCDRNPDPSRFPDQQVEPGAISGDDFTIATLSEVFAFVEAYAQNPTKTDAQRANAASVRFNIETKRKPDEPSAIGDGFDGESMGLFESVIVDEIDAAGVRDRVTVQSFDHRSLWAINAAHPDISLAALTRRNDIPDFADLVRRGATIWSPDYRSVNPSSLASAHAAGLLVVPWTVNDANDMVELLDQGVDGIITDRPDLAPPHD